MKPRPAIALRVRYLNSMEEISMELALQEQFANSKIVPGYEIRIEPETMLPMPDGTRLHTVIYRPDVPEAVPAVLTRTCYPELDGMNRVRAEAYARRGIAFVVQHCRGTGGSGGVWEPNINERADGKATIDWLCAREWVKNAGVLGCSYSAMTGYTIADILPDKVKTMYLTHYGVFRHTSAYRDGLFRHDVLTSWAMANAGFPIKADYIETCRFRPHIEVDEKLWGRRVEWYRDWITADSRTDSYWQYGFWHMLREIPKKINIPIFIGEGWYDHHLGSAIETWQALSDDCRENSTLFIGAWDHLFRPKLDGHVGVNFDNFDDLRALNWFCDILRDGKPPAGRVRVYIIGDDSWNESNKLENETRGVKIFHIGAKDASGSYTLTDNVRDDGFDDGFFEYAYNPQNPVPSHGAESMLFSEDGQGSLLQPAPNYRADIVSCMSDPLVDPVTISGKIIAQLIVSTDVEDTAFVVKIMEVFPDGRTVNIRTGVTTLGFRNNTDTRITYQPNSKVKISIETWDIAWKLQKGSRLRVDITSSDFPQYSAHANYIGCWSMQEKTRTAKQRVYYGSNNDSYISLPVLTWDKAGKKEYGVSL